MASSNGYTDDVTGRFVKGNPGGGRVKGSGLKLTSLLKAKLDEVPEGKKEAYKEIFIKKLLDKALIEGDLQSLKLIMNYVDGLPKQEFDLGENITEFIIQRHGEKDNKTP